MAWNKNLHWYFEAQDLAESNTYRVEIWDSATVTTPIQLQPATNPIVIQEDDDTDFFTPVRTNTGYINVIDPDGTLLESIFPNDATDKLVIIKNNTTQKTLFVGCISCQAYDQTLWSCNDELSLPIRSMLECLKDLKLPNKDNKESWIAPTIYSCLSQFNLEVVGDNTNSLISNVYTQRYQTSGNCNESLRMNEELFFSTIEVTTNSSVNTYKESSSCYDILCNICRFFGFVMRENGSDIYICLPDTQGDKYYVMTWSMVLQEIANVTATQRATVLPSRNSINSITANVSQISPDSDKNSFCINPGMKTVKVNVSTNALSTTFELPVVDELTNASVHYMDNVKVVDQTFETADNSDIIEFQALNYKFKGKYAQDGLFPAYITSTHTIRKTGSKSTSSAVNDSLLVMGNNYPLSAPSNMMSFRHLNTVTDTELDMVARAYMARYDAVSNENTAEPKPALYCQVIPSTNADTFMSEDAWIVKAKCSNFSHVSDGYIGIKGTLDFFDACKRLNKDCHLQMFIAAKINGNYYNGQTGQWQEGFTYQRVDVSNGSLKSNWDDSTDTDADDCYLIPLKDQQGELEVYIYGIVRIWGGYLFCDYTVGQVVFTELEVKYCPKRTAITTKRDKNLYVQDTGAKFEDSKIVESDLFTSNRNTWSYGMLRNWSTDEAAETLSYEDMSNVRPEINLLRRLVRYYKQPMRVLTIDGDTRNANTMALATSAPLYTTINDTATNRKYVCIAVSHAPVDNTARFTLLELPTSAIITEIPGLSEDTDDETVTPGEGDGEAEAPPDE